MKLIGVPPFTMIAIVWLGVQAEAQTPCQEYLRLRNAATEAWKEAMSALPLERCGHYIMPPWPRRRHSSTQITIASHATFLSHC
jgi:hypothetical protein